MQVTAITSRGTILLRHLLPTAKFLTSITSTLSEAIVSRNLTHRASMPTTLTLLWTELKNMIWVQVDSWRKEEQDWDPLKIPG